MTLEEMEEIFELRNLPNDGLALHFGQYNLYVVDRQLVLDVIEEFKRKLPLVLGQIDTFNKTETLMFLLLTAAAESH